MTKSDLLGNPIGPCKMPFKFVSLKFLSSVKNPIDCIIGNFHKTIARMRDDFVYLMKEKGWEEVEYKRGENGKKEFQEVKNLEEKDEREQNGYFPARLNRRVVEDYLEKYGDSVCGSMWVGHDNLIRDADKNILNMVGYGGTDSMVYCVYKNFINKQFDNCMKSFLIVLDARSSAYIIYGKIEPIPKFNPQWGLLRLLAANLEEIRLQVDRYKILDLEATWGPNKEKIKGKVFVNPIREGNFEHAVNELIKM